MPTITNFGDVVTQGNTTATGNLTIQGTGTSSFSSASSAVVMAGTLAVAGVTQHSSNIIPSGDYACGIGTAAQRFTNIFSSNTNVYTTANIFAANIITSNVTNIASFQNSVYHFQNTFLTGYTSTTGVIQPSSTGVSGLGSVSLLFANSYLQTANIGSSTLQQAMNVVGNVFVSNSINVTNLLCVTTNASFLNVLNSANIFNLNVLTSGNTTYLSVTTLANVANANILTANAQFLNAVTANILNLNVSTGANTTYLNVSQIANIANANILTANAQFLNAVTANILNLNVSTGANTTYLNVSQIANVANANILTANMRFSNTVFSNILNLNVSTGTNTTYLTISTLANALSANILTANNQFLNAVTANILNLNVSTGANTTYLNVSQIANITNANILTANAQFLNAVTANILNLNVSTGANTTYLNVSQIANVANANILTANMQFSNTVFSNILNLNVSTGSNTTYLTVSTLANALSANIITANHQFLNTFTSNLININVSSYSNTTNLSVTSNANIYTANIVTQFSSNINVSSNANLFNTNIFTGNVQSAFNAVYAVMTGNYYGNASGVSNLNLSNVNTGTIPFSTTVGAGAAGISINGVTGSAGQFITATGSGSAVQWGGPAATVVWAQVTGFVSPPIYYAVSNVGIGGPYASMSWGYGTSSVNQYPGTPLDVYGGTGSFSNVSDATYTGTIRIQQNAGTWSGNGGLEFKTGTDVSGSGHRIVTTQDPTTGATPLIFQTRAKTKTWSNAVVINCDVTGTTGYVGIGTMIPLYQLHVYQPSSSATVAGTLVQASTASQQAGYSLQNSAAGTCVFYLNGASPSDGAANSATLRNNAGDLRLAAQSTSPYIYLQTSSGNVGIGMTQPQNSLDVNTSFAVSYGNSPTNGYVRMVSTTGINSIQSGLSSASASAAPLVFTDVNRANEWMRLSATGQLGIGTNSPSYKLDVWGGSVARFYGSAANMYVLLDNDTATNQVGIKFNRGGTLQWQEYIPGSSTDIRWNNGTSDKMILTSAGALSLSTSVTTQNGIFTTNCVVGASGAPSTVLQVHGYGSAGSPLRLVSTNAGSEVAIGFYRNTDQSTATAGDMWVYGVGTYSAGDRNLGLGCNSTGTVMSWLANGNVGIAKADPGYKLEVAGQIASTGTNNYHYRAVTNSSTVGCYMLFDAATSGGGRSFQIGSTCSTNASGASCFEIYDTTATAARVTINSSGNVGIGVTTPQTKLFVPATSKTNGITIYNSDVSLNLGNTGGANNYASIQVRAGGSSTGIGTSTYVLALNPEGGSVSIGADTGTGVPSLFYVKSSAVSGAASVPAGTVMTIDKSDGALLTLRQSSDNSSYSGIVFQDNNIGGYMVFKNYTGGATQYGDYLHIAGYNGVYIYAGTSDTVDPANRTCLISACYNSNGSSGTASTVNVGIGITNPSNYTLHVNGSQYTNGTIYFPNNGAGLYWGAAVSRIYDNGNLYIVTDDAMYIQAPSTISVTSPTTSFSGTVNASGLNTSGSGQVALVSGGSSNPGYLAIYNPSNTRVGYVGWQGAANYLYLETENGYVGWNVSGNFIVNGTTALNSTVTTSGSVGINTSSPVSALHIYESTGTAAAYNKGSLTISHGNNSGVSSIVFPSKINFGSDMGHITFIEDSVNTNWTDPNGVAHNYNYWGTTNNTEVATLLIGCENDGPGQGSSGQPGPDSVVIAPAGNVGITPRAGYTYISGSVGIGLTNPSTTFHVSGTIYCSGDIVAYYSDDRLKKRTGLIESPLEKIASLDGFLYVNNDTAKGLGLTDDKQRIGLSAQQVQKVVPEVVQLAPFDSISVNKEETSKSGENYLTVQYDRLIPLLIEALKEEKKLREQLQDEVNSLRELVLNR